MMSQQRRLIYLLLAGMTILGLLAGVYLIAWRRFWKPASGNKTKIVKHTVKTPADDTLAYWTADKKSQAKAVPLPQVNQTEQGKSDPHPSDPHQV